MRLLVLLGVFLSVGVKASAQIAIIENWKESAKFHYKVADFFNRAQKNRKTGDVYFKLKDKEKLPVIYECGSSNEADYFRIGYNRMLGTVRSPFVTDLQMNSDYNVPSCVFGGNPIELQYRGCFDPDNEPALCLDKSYELVRDSREAHLKMAHEKEKKNQLAIDAMTSLKVRESLQAYLVNLGEKLREKEREQVELEQSLNSIHFIFFKSEKQELLRNIDILRSEIQGFKNAIDEQKKFMQVVASAMRKEPSTTSKGLSSTNQLICAHNTIYVQIFGPSMRSRVAQYREPWRLMGASVPPVDDVIMTADSKRLKRPVEDLPRTTVYYHNAVSKPCAEALASAVGEGTEEGENSSWDVMVMPVSPSNRLTPGVIEVWVSTPPK